MSNSGEYKFSFNGVQGNHITDLPGASNKRVNRNKPAPSHVQSFPRSSLPQQQGRHSFGGFASSGLSSSDKKRRRDEDYYFQGNNDIISSFERNGGGGGFKQQQQQSAKPWQKGAPVTPASAKKGSNHATPSSKSAAAAAATGSMKKLSQKIDATISELRNKISQEKKSKKARKFY